MRQEKTAMQDDRSFLSCFIRTTCPSAVLAAVVRTTVYTFVYYVICNVLS